MEYIKKGAEFVFGIYIGLIGISFIDSAIRNFVKEDNNSKSNDNETNDTIEEN